MLNTLKLRSQLKKAISKAPTIIELKRKPKVSDGMNGYTLGEPQAVATFEGLLNLANASYSGASRSEGGSPEKLSKVTLICPYEDNFTILKDDYFTAQGKTYKVVYAIPMYEVQWICELESDT